ncbi:MAG: peptidoglycan DD-metalloendopeptidase family protein [Vulcanibacillus sp.]
MGYYSDIQKKKIKKKSVINNNTESKVKDLFFIRFIASIFLLGIIYLIFSFNQPVALKVQDFIRESLTREYNFLGLYEIYTDKFAGSPAILPTLVKKDKNEFNDFAFIPPFQSPLKTFKQTEQGIIFEIGSEEEIVAIGEGIIVHIDEKNTIGSLIQIRHQGGIVATYAMFNEIKVEVDEWVETGQILGLANNKLYFSIFYKNEYLNPVEVIMFE